MKYLCLAYYEEAKFDTLTPDDLIALRKQCDPHDAELRATGRLGMVGSLAHLQRKVVRSRAGRVSVTDGPFIESKEQVGSIFIVEADDLDDAVRIASKHPAARIGEDLGWAVEIRPIEYFAP